MERATLKLLDHGYIKEIERWGTDASIIEAARMSTDKGFLGWGLRWKCKDCDCLWRHNADNTWSLADAAQMPKACCDNSADFLEKLREVPGDEKLLKYLYDNKHNTPFEFCGMTIEVQAPIFVFREWHRHRTQSYNEMSARYTPLPDLNYIPTVERLLVNSKSNKQAGVVVGAAEMTEKHAEKYRQVLAQHYRTDQEMYEYALRAGVPKELARVHLPVGRYSRMRATTDLRNWLAFLTLRNAPTAQYEIRVYAEAMHELLADAFPRTMEIFDNGKK